MHVGHSKAAPAACCDTRVIDIPRPCKQLIQGCQGTMALTSNVLAVHLLQTENVCLKALERGPQDFGTSLKCHFCLRQKVKALEVESGNPHLFSGCPLATSSRRRALCLPDGAGQVLLQR